MHLLLLICLLGFTTRGANSNPEPNHVVDTDRLALLDIKSKIVQDPQGVLSSWNESTLNRCTWLGVTCGRHARVTALDLSSMGLAGALSPAIGNLSFLREIYLYNNTLSGLIPREVSRLSHLRILDLSSNFFSGEVPTNLSRLSHLQVLDFGKNKLVGSLPTDLHSMLQLRTLSLHDNSLRGDLRFLGNLSFLEAIDLDFNAFEGRIPDTIGMIKGLSELGIGANRFLGPIPSSIFNLSSLTAMSMGGSPIEGTLPDDIGLTLPLLETLIIRDSLLSGEIPVSLSNLSNIQQITLANNSLTGKISISGRNLPNLEWLELPLNHLGSGESNDMNFLDEFINNSNLVGLNVYYNQLAGSLPPSLANLSSLEHLELSTNQFSGGLMSSFFDELINLQYLDLSVNMFTGRVPRSIGKLSMLGTGMFLSNRFSGYIPNEIGNLSRIINLLLDDNEFEGPIPSSIGSCSTLQLLNLSKNHLTGDIPIHLFDAASLSVALDLSSNRLQGNLPMQIGELKNLALLDVSNNGLSGEVPVSLGQCKSLTELYMEGNLFSGSIPSGLSSLGGLVYLDLSRNNFSGQIPIYLADLTLLNLNLSFNNLGEVPIRGVFANARAVSLVGNRGLCGGIKTVNLPKCNARSTSRGSRRRLAAILAASLSCLLVVAAIAILLVWLYVKRKKESISEEALLGKSFERVSYSMLRNATGEFSPRNLIGVGGFGSVYRGMLDLKGKKLPIAAKVLNLEHHRGAKSFKRECNALRSIRHRNLVKIISTCSSIDFQGNDFKALVYELMPNGSLDRWLHSRQRQENEHESHGTQNLSLLLRLNIAIDVACALDYLHNECDIQVVHCDLKPSNILLDNNMVAHVGDFGLARLLPELMDHSCSNTSLGIKGTVGYAAPEYGLGNQVSASGDVYSFGIILLEMLTGKAPSDKIFQNGLCLHEHAKNANLENLMEIIDQRLLEADHGTEERCIDEEQGEATADCLLSAIKIGVECSMELPKERMSIRDAIEQLKLTRNALLGRLGARIEA